MSRRQRLGGLLDAIGVVDGVKRARMAFGVSPFPVLTYHRIAPKDGSDPFDPDVIDATPQVFDEHVRMLARNFTLVGTREIRAHFMGTRSLPANAAMITFDDGYKSCLEVALPILRRYGARAVFFVSTGHVTERRLFWWDRTSYIVRQSKAAEIRLEYPEPIHIVRRPYDLQKVTTRLLRIIKDTYGLDVERFLTELAQAAGVPWSNEVDARLADDLLLTWDEVRALRDAGMDIESHTRWHRVLDTLTPAELEEELVGSREDLEAQLSDPVRAIAYPVGRGGDHRVAMAVARAGYDLGFSNATGINDFRSAMAPLSVRRAAVDAWVSDAVLRASMVVPNLTEVSPPRKTR
ncbi:polysaccharide deacetylase family protein [Pendulispora albinea]|uniref:Polysaccharide deacetylase family protein n=1 Tax=Pendulispora albinea TaxID=2741071 RepID=A0ABZ2LMK6_9BACT